MGVILEKGGSSKEEARIKQRSSKDDFGKKDCCIQLAAPRYGVCLSKLLYARRKKMTEVNLNETVDGYRGSIGRLVFKRYKGRTIVSRKPKIEKPPTEAQLAQRERFREAAAFGKSAQADPALLEFYAPIALERNISVYVLAMGDFLSLPTIKPLDLSKYKGRVGDPIMISAKDDIGLDDVDVTIVSNQGAPIEQGKAVEIGARSGKWVYTATAPVALGSDIFIEIVGVDHAGNRVKMTESPRVGENS
jgi:hypothetical protein